MLTSLFLKGWIVGFSIAMPVGPIGMLCIQHALIRGMLYGLVAGFGAALADGIYGAIAGFGVTMVSNFLTTYQLWLHLAGAAFLWYLGFTILFSQPCSNNIEATRLTLKRVFFTTFALTLTNPMTIICFAGAYAGLGVCPTEEGLLSALMLTMGVLVGSAAWWLLLCTGVSMLGKKMTAPPTQWLNRISGGVLLTFALVASLTAIQQMF